jgi:hypothetical protein
VLLIVKPLLETKTHFEAANTSSRGRLAAIDIENAQQDVFKN